MTYIYQNFNSTFKTSYSFQGNKSEENNGGCEQNCKDTPTYFEFSCREGYVLNSNGYTCNGMLKIYLQC